MSRIRNSIKNTYKHKRKLKHNVLTMLEIAIAILIFTVSLCALAIVIIRAYNSTIAFTNACNYLQNIRNMEWCYWASNYIEAINEHNQHSSTLEIYALVYTFISTGIVGIGLYLLKTYHSHEKEIENKIIKMSEHEQESLMRISEVQSIVYELLLAKQQLWSMDMVVIKKDISELYNIYPNFIKITSTIRDRILSLGSINEMQGQIVLELLDEVLQHLAIMYNSIKYRTIGMGPQINTSIDRFEQIKSTVYKLLKEEA